MDSNTLQSNIFKALLWGLTYYFIRRGLNPENKDITKFKSDAIYGSIAALVSSIMAFYLDKYVVPII